eukprot:jgi/Chlat1/961/Chrsp108S01433
MQTLHVKREDECKAMVCECMERFGGVDFHCLNAGADHSFLFEEANSTKGFKDILDVDFLGAVYSTHRAPKALKRTQGQILITASVAAFIPFLHQSLYTHHKPPSSTSSTPCASSCLAWWASLWRAPVKTEITDGHKCMEELRERAKEHSEVWMPMVEANDCAKRMVNAVLARRRYLVSPRIVVRDSACYVKHFHKAM